MTALLVTDGLTKRFGGVAAVDRCSIEVGEGTITALIGPNGSGKTTLFNLVTGYLRADSGTVTFAGRRMRRPDPGTLCRRGLARTFQQSRVFGSLTLVENLAAAVHEPRRGLFRRAVPKAHGKRALQVLEQFGLAGMAGSRADQLSYGQRKLLEFATVVIARPRLVLLDEPTAGVNPVMMETLERHIRALHADGLTFLIVEHDMPTVMRLCDPVMVLDGGTKIAEGPPEVVQRDPAVLDAYLGT